VIRKVLKLTRLLSRITSRALSPDQLEFYINILGTLNMLDNTTIIFCYWKEVLRVYCMANPAFDPAIRRTFLSRILQVASAIARNRSLTVLARLVPLAAFSVLWGEIRSSCPLTPNFLPTLIVLEAFVYRAEVSSSGESLPQPSFDFLKKTVRIDGPERTCDYLLTMLTQLLPSLRPEMPPLVAECSAVAVCVFLARGLEVMPFAMRERMATVFDIVRHVMQNVALTPVVLRSILCFFCGLARDRFAEFLPEIWEFVSEGLHCDNPEVALIFFEAIPKLAGHIDPERLWEIVGSGQSFLQLSPPTYFEVVASFLERDVEISAETEEAILAMLFNSVTSPPEVFTAVLIALIGFLGRSEKFCPVVFERLAPLFGELVSSDSFDYAYAIATFLAHMIVLFGDAASNFVRPFALPVCSMLFRSDIPQYDLHLGPLAALVEDGDGFAAFLIAGVQDGTFRNGLPYIALSDISHVMSTGHLSEFLTLAFAWMSRAEASAGENELDDFIEHVLCGTLERRKDASDICFDIGDWIIGLRAANRYMGVSVYRFTSYLFPCDPGPRRDGFVEWILAGIRAPDPVDVFYLLGCCAELLALNLFPEGDLETLAVVALSSLERGPGPQEQVFLEHAISELAKINYAGFVEAIVGRMEGFVDWIRNAKGDTIGILGGMLLRVGVERGFDASFFRFIIGLFPGDDISIYASHLVEGILAVAQIEELMGQVSGDVLLALGRYFCAKPLLRANMELKPDIVDAMRLLFVHLVTSAGIGVSELLGMFGSTDIIRWRLEMILGSA
jgi:hypothetical protein